MLINNIAIFLQTISEPQGAKKKHFAKLQEAARKDIERAFGVLQACFAIISLPCWLWATKTMTTIMKAAIILHNMIIEDEQDLSLDQQYEITLSIDYYTTTANRIMVKNDIGHIIERFKKICDETQHYQLRNDLIEHLWQRKGEQE